MYLHSSIYNITTLTASKYCCLIFKLIIVVHKNRINVNYLFKENHLHNQVIFSIYVSFIRSPVHLPYAVHLERKKSLFRVLPCPG